MRNLKRMMFLMLVLVLAACTSHPGGTVQPTETVTATVIPTSASTPFPISVYPTSNESGVVLDITGTGPDSSHTFKLEAETTLRVKWQQNSTGYFRLFIRSLDPSQAGTQNEKVSFEMIKGPSSGFADYPFVAGEYQVDVEQADGPWEIRISLVTH